MCVGKHTNFITNWAEVVAAVELLPNVRVTAYAPVQVPFAEQVRVTSYHSKRQNHFRGQVQHYRRADVVISLWGGISMLNFLLRPGKVEIVITSWFEDNGMMPLPNTTTAADGKVAVSMPTLYVSVIASFSASPSAVGVP